MLKPLILAPHAKAEHSVISEGECSPSNRKRADSLVFSITSQKHFSPKDTILLESRQEDVSKELESLQLKLCSLEDKVQFITTDHLPSLPHERSSTKVRQESRFMIDCSQVLRQASKQNYNRQNRAGKIVKKDKSIEKSSKIEKISRKSEKSKVEACQSRTSAISKDKAKELLQLRKVVNKMKHSIQKSERSQSICSERLSASKSLIKNLRRQQKKNERIISNLRAQLKKSQNIRDKQKQVILRQQAEISHYRQLLKLSRPLR